MNFNVYLRKNVGEQITKAAGMMCRSRNSIISEAVEEWLHRHTNEWPQGFFDFDPIKDVPDFKKYRKDLKKISKDPLK